MCSHKTWQHESTQPMNIQAVCHTAQDKTRMHAHSHTQRDRTWSASVRTPSRNRNSRHECRDPNTTLQHETRHADERAHGSSTFEATRSHETRTWREYQGSVTKPWITLDRSDRTLTTGLNIVGTGACLPWCSISASKQFEYVLASMLWVSGVLVLEFQDSRFIRHIHNYTGYNQQWNVSQVCSMDSAIICNTTQENIHT